MMKLLFDEDFIQEMHDKAIAKDAREEERQKIQSEMDKKDAELVALRARLAKYEDKQSA